MSQRLPHTPPKVSSLVTPLPKLIPFNTPPSATLIFLSSPVPHQAVCISSFVTPLPCPTASRKFPTLVPRNCISSLFPSTPPFTALIPKPSIIILTHLLKSASCLSHKLTISLLSPTGTLASHVISAQRIAPGVFGNENDAPDADVGMGRIPGLRFGTDSSSLLVVVMGQVVEKLDVRVAVQVDDGVDAMRGNQRSDRVLFRHGYAVDNGLYFFCAGKHDGAGDDGSGCKKDVHSVHAHVMFKVEARESMVADLNERVWI
ncbi:hypothetical protein BKA63DRAFT_525584 [Paraphoma chrysanthemicola]|nr:hypothetical protein BKA63DRAFT_525584 [Paraphoma chrysanthemicola]